jgi:diacylglycerol O-acyltransferase / wax synthase
LDIVLRLSPLMVRMPGAVLGALAGRMTKTQDAQISNVPSFSQAMYVAGAKVLQIWPLGPAPGCAVMIGMMSYDGRCGVGITTDRAAVTEPELLSGCLLEGLNEVIALASAQVEPAKGNVPARRPRDAARKGKRTASSGRN